MALGTLVRTGMLTVVAAALALEFVGGFGTVDCAVVHAERKVTHRACEVEATCSDGVAREGTIPWRRGRGGIDSWGAPCPSEAWWSPAWGELRAPSPLSGYRWTLILGGLTALAWIPLGLLDPRAVGRDDGPPPAVPNVTWRRRA